MRHNWENPQTQGLDQSASWTAEIKEDCIRRVRETVVLHPHCPSLKLHKATPWGQAWACTFSSGKRDQGEGLALPMLYDLVSWSSLGESAGLDHLVSEREKRGGAYSNQFSDLGGPQPETTLKQERLQSPADSLAQLLSPANGTTLLVM